MHRPFNNALFITFITVIGLVTSSAHATANTDATKKMAETVMKDKKMMPQMSNEESLAMILPQEEVTWLTGESGKFLALKRDYLAAKHRGVAIFVSDLSAPINYSLDIEPLRTTINNYGFSSITINAPSLELFAAATAENAEEKTPVDSKETMSSPAMTSPVDAAPYTKALIERINSAHKMAAAESKNIILVIQGRQVAYLSNALIQQHLRPLNAVVVIDANSALYDNQPQMYPATIEQLSRQLVQIKMPLLDIYHLSNSKIDMQMKMRKRLSLKAKKTSYRQHLKPTYSEEKTLAKVVYGWLKSLGIH
ncbi:DUF3530 family protein [Psychrobium sp. nBUS_13]|uniref:DUF3530 family protein n=1 Tax=Psychrobium sp. nBUS_13 TaxID=3395319 RepID=UPI003EBFF1C8